MEPPAESGLVLTVGLSQPIIQPTATQRAPHTARPTRTMETFLALKPFLPVLAKALVFLNTIAGIFKLWLENRRPTSKNNRKDS